MVKEPHGPVITCLTCFYLQDHPLPTGTYAAKLAPHQPIHRRRSHGQKSERDDFGRPGLNLSFSRVGAIAEKTLERWMIRADFGFGIGMRLRVAAPGGIGQHRPNRPDRPKQMPLISQKLVLPRLGMKMKFP